MWVNFIFDPITILLMRFILQSVHYYLKYFLVCYLIYLNTSILHFQSKITELVAVYKVGEVQDFV